ncbi:hypothetical protein [Polycyclovorans algicola]|uniref:hypothetical protein n=1 Tax=Polycyclovorans algicola TaxID=616992 RepID=UPI0004A6CA9C|nr:hypothetical protein [Polycyclovorans algicola]
MNPELPDIRLDVTQMHREESFTDRRTGVLRRLVPVTLDGTDDPSRPTIYEGQASLMTQGGALPLHFGIEADSLEAAVEAFPAAAQKALQEMVQEMERMRREQASSIVVPGQGGGGRIQL